MSMIAENLAAITAAVGQDNIARLPTVDTIEAVPQDKDESAFAYKLFYGTGKKKAKQSYLDEIWIYLLTYMNKPPETKFVIYPNNNHNSDPEICDGEFVGRIVEEQSGSSTAFGPITKNRKIRALAKYHFLALMNHLGSGDDELKTPFNISKTWIGELKAVCQDFPIEPMGRGTRKNKSGKTARKTHYKANTAPKAKARQNYPPSRSPVGFSTPPNPTTSDIVDNGHAEDDMDVRSISTLSGVVVNLTTSDIPDGGHAEDDMDMSSSTMLSDLTAGALDIIGEAQADVQGAGDDEVTRSLIATGLDRDATRSRSQELLPHLSRQLATVRSYMASTIVRPALASTSLPTVEDPDTSDQDIEAFNQFHDAEAAFNQEKEILSAEKEERIETIKRAKGELDVLNEKTADVDRALDAVSSGKRELMSTMSHDEQLEFMYRAGQAAKSKRQRLG